MQFIILQNHPPFIVYCRFLCDRIDATDDAGFVTIGELNKDRLID